MEFHGVEEFMWMLKAKYDLSERKQDWRALGGRNHLDHTYDTFVFSDEKVYQIKSVEVMPSKMLAVGAEVGEVSKDMLRLIESGSPVPINVVSIAKGVNPVIMLGTQQYSSDISDVFRTEYFSSKQDRFKRDLDRKVRTVLERPEYRAAYRSLRESEDGYFA